jgi:hypothetical protein
MLPKVWTLQYCGTAAVLYHCHKRKGSAEKPKRLSRKGSAYAIRQPTFLKILPGTSFITPPQRHGALGFRRTNPLAYSYCLLIMKGQSLCVPQARDKHRTPFLTVACGPICRHCSQMINMRSGDCAMLLSTCELHQHLCVKAINDARTFLDAADCDEIRREDAMHMLQEWEESNEVMNVS